MSSVRNVAEVGDATGRAPRCRLLNELGDRCTNPSADPDPGAIQICPAHALKAALLLVDVGAIRITYTNRARKAAS